MKDYLTDGRIALRKYHPGDEVGLYEAVCESIAELTPWGFFHPNFSPADAAEDVTERIASWDSGCAYNFLIETLPDSAFLGNCNIAELELEKHQAAMGWWVRTSQTRRGIATIAARLVAQAAFEALPLRKLIIYARRENTASRRVAEKIGAVLRQVRLEEDGIWCAVYDLKPTKPTD